MTKTQTITAVSAVLLMLAASAWLLTPRSTHQITIAPVNAVQR
jgi:hypothetical protein